MNYQKIFQVLRNISFILLTILAAFWFIFALFSGSTGGIKSILLNSPNALPWLLLFAVIYLIWKFEFIGGIALVILGITSAFFFDAFQSPAVLLFISLPLIIFGVIFILNQKLKNA